LTGSTGYSGFFVRHFPEENDETQYAKGAYFNLAEGDAVSRLSSPPASPERLAMAGRRKA
jgi:hypothetical protein